MWPLLPEDLWDPLVQADVRSCGVLDLPLTRSDWWSPPQMDSLYHCDTCCSSDSADFALKCQNSSELCSWSSFPLKPYSWPGVSPSMPKAPQLSLKAGVSPRPALRPTPPLGAASQSLWGWSRHLPQPCLLPCFLSWLVVPVTRITTGSAVRQTLQKTFPPPGTCVTVDQELSNRCPESNAEGWSYTLEWFFPKKHELLSLRSFWSDREMGGVQATFFGRLWGILLLRWPMSWVSRMRKGWGPVTSCPIPESLSGST